MANGKLAVAKTKVTQAAITKVADQLIAEGINPTVLGVRKILAAGSTATINKYLRIWKQTKLSGKSNIVSVQLDLLQAQLQELQISLRQQQNINQELLQELYKEQQASSQLEIRLQTLAQEKNDLNLAQQALAQDYAVLQAKYSEVTTERSVAWQVMQTDKQQQISLLQEELLSAHKSLKDEVLDLSYKNQEVLLAEKVKLIKQTDLNGQLQVQIKQLQQQQIELVMEKSKLQRQLMAFKPADE